MNFEIVPITEKHIEGFWSAVDSVAREREYLAFLEGPPINTTKDFVIQNINDNWPHVVAINNGKIIGWCDISALDRPVFAHIGSLGIGVLAPYRGQGVGMALMNAALQKAKLKGLTRIELTVREKNTSAIALYEKMGFEKEGIHKNAVCIDGKYENHIFMALLSEDIKSAKTILLNESTSAHQFYMEESSNAKVEAILFDGIKSYNESIIGKYTRKPFTIYTKAKANGKIIGGCEGNITGRFCYVHRMWVDPDYREKGFGSELIHQIENYAKNNNCLTVSLDTAEFQAKGFYEKLGYLVISIVDGVIFPGYKQYFMSKNL